MNDVKEVKKTISEKLERRNKEPDITLSITLNSVKDSYYYDRIKNIDNKEKYLRYLMELESVVEGNNDELFGYMPAQKIVEKLNETEIEEKITANLKGIKKDLLAISEVGKDYTENNVTNDGIAYISEYSALYNAIFKLEMIIELLKKKGLKING